MRLNAFVSTYGSVMAYWYHHATALVSTYGSIMAYWYHHATALVSTYGSVMAYWYHHATALVSIIILVPVCRRLSLYQHTGTSMLQPLLSSA